VNPPEEAGPTPDPVAAVPPPGPAPEPPLPEPPATLEPDPITLRPYDLPTARGVVSFGLSLAYGASSELRRASLYIGLLTLALLGPPIVLLIEFIAHYDLTNPETITTAFGFQPDPAIAAPLITLSLLLYPALAGWFAVSIDGQLIAVALLAAREGERHFTLREATIRARQCFWRVVRGSLIVGLASLVIQLVIGVVVAAVLTAGTGSDFVVSVIGVVILAPLGYLTTGIVLGDVGALESLRRSMRLARARPRIALVVALFTLVTAAIQLFALLGGLDLFIRLATVVHLGFEGGVGPLVGVILGILALVMAFGSLSFTVAAIVAAPQVAAFLGLTYYTAGLDKVVEQPPTGPRFRWVTRPMIVLIVLVVLGSGAGIASLQGASPAATLGSLVRDAAVGHATVSIEGDVEAFADARGDGVGGRLPGSADIVAGSVAYLATVPTWLLDGTFGCGLQTVACSALGSKAEFDQGAYLVFERVASPPETGSGAHDWGPTFKFRGARGAPEPNPIAGSSDAFLTLWRRSGKAIHRYTFEGDSFVELDTTARSAWIGDSLLTLIPFRTAIAILPDAWNVYSSTGDYLVGETVTSDSIGEPPADGLYPFFEPATITFDPPGP
jgi:hypothetical protein